MEQDHYCEKVETPWDTGVFGALGGDAEDIANPETSSHQIAAASGGRQKVLQYKLYLLQPMKAKSGDSCLSVWATKCLQETRVLPQRGYPCGSIVGEWA